MMYETLDVFLRLGFTGLGAGITFLALFGCILSSIIISFMKRVTLKSLSLLSLPLAVVSLIILFKEWPSDFIYVLCVFFWLLYFLLIPQLIVRSILAQIAKKKKKIPQWGIGVMRVILAFLIFEALIFLHLFVASNIIGISGS